VRGYEGGAWLGNKEPERFTYDFPKFRFVGVLQALPLFVVVVLLFLTMKTKPLRLLASLLVLPLKCYGFCFPLIA